MRTLGIHFVWTTYLTWLPGDPRGHWSGLFDFYGNLIRRGHQLNLPDAVTYERSLAIAKEPAILLSESEMATVAMVIGTLVAPVSPPLAAGFSTSRDPRPAAYAFAIENNHAHLLTGPIQEDLSKFIGRVKGMTSSAVLRHVGNEKRTRVWTSGFWKVFLFDEPGVRAVKRYIEDHNVRRDCLRVWWNGLRRLIERSEDPPQGGEVKTRRKRRAKCYCAGCVIKPSATPQITCAAIMSRLRSLGCRAADGCNSNAGSTPR